MYKHTDDTVLWALDFVLLKGEAPQTVFNRKDKYILIETSSGRILRGVSFFVFFLFFFFFPFSFIFVHLREQGFQCSLLISLSKYRF